MSLNAFLAVLILAVGVVLGHQRKIPLKVVAYVIGFSVVAYLITILITASQLRFVTP